MVRMGRNLTRYLIYNRIVHDAHILSYRHSSNQPWASLLASTIMSLPIIDIAPFLNSSDPSVREATAAEIHNACFNYGFFYLNISAYADPSEPEELATLARSFFSLAQEEKDKISLGNNDKTRG